MQRAEVGEEVAERPAGVRREGGGVEEADDAVCGWDVREEGGVLFDGREGRLAVKGADEEEGARGGMELRLDCGELAGRLEGSIQSMGDAIRT